MLAKAKELLEYRNGMVAIHPSHNKLIISLRTTVENGEGSLDKEATSHDKLVNKRPAVDTDVTLRYMILLNKEISWGRVFSYSRRLHTWSYPV